VFQQECVGQWIFTWESNKSNSGKHSDMSKQRRKRTSMIKSLSKVIILIES
jgi:hypothetical protein